MQGMNAMFILDGPTWSKQDEEERSGVGVKALLEEEEESTRCLGWKLAASMESEAASSMWDEEESEAEEESSEAEEEELESGDAASA